MGHSWRLVGASAILVGMTVYACGDGGGSDRRGPQVLSGKATEVPEVVEEFRALLGRDNGGVPERAFTGRREVNWDGVPDENSSPGFLSPEFFNSRTAPRARGIRLRTPGEGVQVSADSDNPSGTPVRFGNINPTYATEFTTFSAERLFSPIGSNIVDVTFCVAGTPEVPALVRGFGAVYTDIDEAESSFEFFAEDDVSLGKFSVPADDKGLSFLGVLFDNPVVKRVRIAYGNRALGPTDGGGVDVAVMDDFIYGEPQPQD